MTPNWLKAKMTPDYGNTADGLRERAQRAEAEVERLRARVADLEDERSGAIDDLLRVEDDRDDWKAEVERLREALATLADAVVAHQDARRGALRGVGSPDLSAPYDRVQRALLAARTTLAGETRA